MRLVAILALLLAAPASGATTATSGLRGLVTRGPTSPVCREGVPCSAPAPGVKLTFVRGGVARSVTTDADGHYRIALRPGLYAVRIPSARFGYEPRQAVVPVGRFAVRRFAIDTGIR